MTISAVYEILRPLGLFADWVFEFAMDLSFMIWNGSFSECINHIHAKRCWSEAPT